MIIVLICFLVAIALSFVALLKRKAVSATSQDSPAITSLQQTEQAIEKRNLPEASKVEKQIGSFIEDHKHNGWAIANRVRATRQETSGQILDQKVHVAAELITLKGQQSSMHVAEKKYEDTIIQTPRRLEEVNQLEIEAHKQTIATAANKIQVIEMATEKKLYAPTYLATEEQRQLNAIELDKQRGESEIKVTEHRALGEIDVDLDLREKLNTLDAIRQYKHIHFTEFDELGQRLEVLIADEQRLMAIPNSEEQLRVTRERKETYATLFRQCKTRLLETSDQEVISGLNAITDLIRPPEYGDTTTRVEVSAEKPRGRGRPKSKPQ